MQGFYFTRMEVTAMPRSPKKPCRYPGCPKLTDGRYCAEHQKAVDRRYNRYERDPESRNRYGSEWRKVRDRYIMEHPLCEECLKQGRLTPASECHHVRPLFDGGTSDFDNLMSLCKNCHSAVTLAANNKNRSKELAVHFSE